MPAYFDTGFTVREPAWHGLGHVLADYPSSWDEARKMAGLEWEPVKAPAYALTPGDVTEVDGEPVVTPDTYEAVPNLNLVRRSDNGDVIGSVSDRYQFVTHAEMGEVMEAVLGLPNVRYETAGSIKGGAMTWALVRIDEPLMIAGDDSPTYPYIAALNGHTGNDAFSLLPTSIRVVCWNTYDAATMEGKRHGRTFTFRHTGSVMERVAEARAAITGTREETQRWVTLANDLATLPAREHEWATFIRGFIPDPTDHAGDVVSERVRNNVAKNRKVLRDCIEASPTTDGHRGTALGLVDAAVEYLDHLRGYRNVETYMGRCLLQREPLKARAVDLAREVCTAGA